MIILFLQFLQTNSSNELTETNSTTFCSVTIGTNYCFDCHFFDSDNNYSNRNLLSLRHETNNLDKHMGFLLEYLLFYVFYSERIPLFCI